MILAQQPPQTLLAQEDYYQRQRLFPDGAFDFSSSSPTSSVTRSHDESDFSTTLESVALAFEDSNPFISKFQNSLSVPFADQFPAASGQQQEQEQQSESDDTFMNRTGDFYSPNRTRQAASRSALSQQSDPHSGQQQPQQSQWYQLAGTQSHLANQPRSRFHGQLAGHKRNNSGSTITSTGPSSPFTPAVQPYPQIHDPEAAAQHYSSPLSGDYDSIHHQQQSVFPKPLPAGQSFTESFFSTNYDGQQQPQQTFHNQHHSHGDLNLAYQVMMRRAMMSQDSNGSNGSIPSLQRLPTSEFDRDFKATMESRGTVPKFDRTLSEIYQDELYNPNLSAATPTSQPQHQQANPTAHRDVFSERLQAASDGHLSARSGTPATMLSRDRSPFVATSAYVNDEIATSTHPGSSPGSRFGTAAHLRERQKAEADAAAWSQTQSRRSLEEPKTISPKDALLDNVDSDAEPMPSLFPQPDASHRFSLPQDPQYSMQHDPNFGGEVPRRGSASMTHQQRQRHHSHQQQRPPQGLGPPYASQESNPEFPANLTSMESTRSDAHSTHTSSSQHSDSSTRASSDMPIQRPNNTTAHAGSYACHQPGCNARFDGPGRLQRHRRDVHGTPNAHSSPVHVSGHARALSTGSPAGEAVQATLPAGTYGIDDQSGGLTGSALAARNSQSGPHKCERVNPSTGKPCNSIFSRPYDLTRHEETIHNARKMKVRCQFCTEEKTFSRADALTRHMRVVHPEMEVAGKRARRS